MILCQSHNVKRNSSNYKKIDHLLFLSKNLFNASIFAIRQEYLASKKILSGFDLAKKFAEENNPDYRALPAKVSQQICIQVGTAYKTFFAALKSYKVTPSKFKAPPKIPAYKDKAKGRNILVYTNQAIRCNKKNILTLSGTDIVLPTKLAKKDIKQARVVKTSTGIKIEILYIKPEKTHVLNDSVAAIDLGVANLATLTYSSGKQPLVVPGGPVKSINQFYNKKLAEFKSELKGPKTSKKIVKLTDKRNNKISDYMHKASAFITNQLVSKNVSTLVVGYNKNWKQEVNIGDKNNQNFVQIPHRKFVDQLIYKCTLEGIKVQENNEAYTSKCSFLDLEEIKKQKTYLGKRAKRGMFISASKRKINADVNGSYNILRKVIPEAFNNFVVKGKGIEGVVVHPVRVKTYEKSMWKIIP
jgi:putative transposase